MKTPAMLALAGLVTLGMPPAVAQQAGQPPPQVGNRVDSKDLQPSRSEVRQEEQAAGLRGTPGQEEHRADEVEQLDKQVMQRAQQGSNDGVMNGTAATKPP